MSERIAFHNAICAEPEEDAPRLVFADWLDEQGDSARAELIRVQCALAHLTEADADWWTHGDRERALLAEHGERWRQSLSPCLRTACEFRRGFPVSGRIESGHLLRQARHVAACGPIEHLHVDVGWSNDWAALATCPAFNRVGRLTVVSRGSPWTDEVFRFITSPHLTQVRQLRLQDVDLGPAGVERLAAWPGLSRFRRLGLFHSRLTPTDLQHIADSPFVDQLREFDSNALVPKADGSCALFGSTQLRSLETLRLGPEFDRWAIVAMVNALALPALRELSISSIPGWPYVGPESATAVAKCPALVHLRSLSFHQSAIGPAGVRSLADSLSHLENVGLPGNEIGNAGLAALSRGRFADRLRIANLTANGIDADGLAELARVSLPELRSLSLSANAIEGHGAIWLGGAGWASRLRVLDLSHCRLGDDGARALARAPLSSLRSLDLAENGITDVGVSALLGAGWLAGLRRLDLSGNSLGPASARLIAASPHLESLWRLSLSDRFGEAAARQLQERFGNRLELSIPF